MMTFIRCAVVVLMLTPSFTIAQNFNVGRGAYDVGDFAKALREWKPLAAQGDERAQFFLGGMYATGKGVTQDHSEALKWWRMAAENGHMYAQFLLGRMYAIGEGVAKDYTKAVPWLRSAAAQGHARAQSALGHMYANGNGVVQDYVTAHMWFNVAAVNGSEIARDNRDVAASRMTSEGILEAQQRARACLESDYQDCD